MSSSQFRVFRVAQFLFRVTWTLSRGGLGGLVQRSGWRAYRSPACRRQTPTGPHGSRLRSGKRLSLMADFQDVSHR